MSFPTWDGNLSKLFESLQNADGSSVEEYNHIIAKLLNTITSQSFHVQNGIVYVQDTLRGKLLSISRSMHTFGYYGPNQDSRYLKHGDVVSVGNGLMMLRDATITGITTRSRSNTNFTIEIRRNDNLTALSSIAVPLGVLASDSVDIDIQAGDYVQLYIDGTAIDHPVAMIELAWRI